jgi:FdhD protein
VAESTGWGGIAAYHEPVVREMTGDPIPPVRHVTSRRIVAVRGESLEVRDDRIVGEAPLEIRAAGPRQEPVAVAVTMRTPGNEAELAVGFLRTEGLLDGQEVVSTAGGDPGSLSQPDDTIVVRLSKAFDDSKIAERHFVATASCGICGKASIDEVVLRTDPLPDGPVVSRSVILALPDMLRAAQRAFDETGGLHAAGLFSAKGELIALREDVGRHNALDKLVGSQVLAGAMPLHDRILMVSGRVSFEIVQKAAVAGIPIVCAVSAPSDLAIETAERLGVTLVGFLRGDGFNVYAHDARIDLRDLSGLG